MGKDTAKKNKNQGTTTNLASQLNLTMEAD